MAAGGVGRARAAAIVRIPLASISAAGRFTHDDDNVYTINAFRSQDYAPGSELELNLDRVNRTASLVQAPPTQEALGLDELQRREEARKARAEAALIRKLANATITVIDSAFHHNASGDGRSRYVGTRDNDNTRNWVIATLRNRSHEVRYTGKGPGGALECVLRLDAGESIAFSYRQDSFTVRHIGPGG